MNRPERVIGLIESYGHAKILDICSKFGKNRKVEIVSENVLSFCVEDFNSSENVYTLKELLDGLESYSQSIRLDDEKKYKVLREVFEPIVRDTEWYKKNYSLGSCGSGTVFTFFNGRYTQNQMVQGMFEVFLRVYQL